MKSEGLEPNSWVIDMMASGNSSFYNVKEGATYYYSISNKIQTKVPGQDAFIILNNIRESKKVWSNSGAIIQDLGDGILNLEFQSKMNTIGGDVLQAINKAIDGDKNVPRHNDARSIFWDSSDCCSSRNDFGRWLRNEHACR